MAIRIPLFGLLSPRSPMKGLLEHYEEIAKGLLLIGKAMRCYITRGSENSPHQFPLLLQELNEVEEQADIIKRYVLNHLPRGLFFSVDKQAYFRYARTQDTILDAGVASLQWLAMREVGVPEEFQKELHSLLDEVGLTIKMLRTALSDTAELLEGKGVDRIGVKEDYKRLRAQHKRVNTMAYELISTIYRSSLDFKDIYQLIHLVQNWQAMSHRAEQCTSILRVMIAR